MGEQKQFRSEQARKNYQKQERQRALAARRKALRSRLQTLTDSALTWVKQNTRQAILIALAAVLAVVLLWLGCKWCFGPGGSLPNFFGTLRGVEDTWVVTDLNPHTNSHKNSALADSYAYSKTPRYFHVATLAPLEGYTQDPGFTLSSDGMNQDQHYINDDENAVLNSAYVFGIANKTSEQHVADMVDSMTGMAGAISDVARDTIAGFDTTYVYFLYNQDPDETGTVTEAYASLCMCIDTTEDACVLVLLNSYILPVDEVPTLEAMVAESEFVLKHLTVK